MDKQITAVLDNLTVEQTERLLPEDIEMEIVDKLQAKRIKNNVYKKTGKRNRVLSKTVLAWATAAAVVFASLSIVGFDNVAIAFRRIFTFIPGVGIVENNKDLVYTTAPIVSEVETLGANARLVSAVYAQGRLAVTVKVVGKDVFYDDFLLFINGAQEDYWKEGVSSLGKASDSALLTFSMESPGPKADDLYEIKVNGFPNQLAFKMVPCLEYEDFKKIGPGDIHNGISVTATAHRVGDRLIVWCYPFQIDGGTGDPIVGYGVPGFGANFQRRFIETESGPIYDEEEGFVLRNEIVFTMGAADKTAVLHLPYLSMAREEKHTLNISLPKDHGAVPQDITVDCSLGKIKIWEIERLSAESSGKDTVLLKFKFENDNPAKELYSFTIKPTKQTESVWSTFASEEGRLDYLGLIAEEGLDSIELEITGLEYYLIGEYIIPLDIK